MSIARSAVVSGPAGAIVVGPVLNTRTGQLVAWGWIGARSVFTAAVNTGFWAVAGIVTTPAASTLANRRAAASDPAAGFLA